MGLGTPVPGFIMIFLFAKNKTTKKVVSQGIFLACCHVFGICVIICFQVFLFILTRFKLVGCTCLFKLYIFNIYIF